MKIEIESTTKIVYFRDGEFDVSNGVPARIWEGKTASGIPVHCYITLIAAKTGLDTSTYAEFEKELQEQKSPSAEIQAIPLRMII